MPQSAPFSFQFFDEPSDAPDQKTLTIAQVDIDAAFAAGRDEGIEEGRRAALDSLVAAEADALRAIAEVLVSEKNTTRDWLVEEAERLRAAARAVVSHICLTFATTHELETATQLVNRLIAVSTDRAPTSLLISKSATKEIRTRLEAMIADKKLDDYITVQTDKALRPGDVRLSWRGGAVQQTHEEIRAVIDMALAEPVDEKELMK
jgi:flagellar biosynthesis/type III secretory pathway protein FliH